MVKLTRPVDITPLSSIVLEALSELPSRIEYKNLLNILSGYYHKFIESDIKKISIRIPLNDRDFIDFFSKYLYFFDLLLKLKESEDIKDYPGTMIFEKEPSRIVFSGNSVLKDDFLWPVNRKSP